MIDPWGTAWSILGWAFLFFVLCVLCLIVAGIIKGSYKSIVRRRRKELSPWDKSRLTKTAEEYKRLGEQEGLLVFKDDWMFGSVKAAAFGLGARWAYLKFHNIK